MRQLDVRSLPYQFLRHVTLPARIFWLAARLVNDLFLLGVAGVIYDDEGRLLLFHHTYRRRKPWGLPGGWMMRGESPLQALEREVYEETGLTVRAERLLLVGTTEDRAKIDFIVGARLVDGAFRPSREVSDIGWFAADQLPPLPSFHHTILREVELLGAGAVGWYTTVWELREKP